MAPKTEGSHQMAPIIVIKKKKAGGHGHHGGAWKVAYADFVTAMMAFFLLLWLLNVTTSQQKQAIANYFDPTSVSDSTSGSGGIMGGQSMMSPGAKVSEAVPAGVSIPLPGDPATDNGKADKNNPDKNTAAQDNAGTVKTQSDAEDEAAKAAAAKIEEKNFKEVEASIKQAIQSVPELQPLAQNLIIDQTPEGLRIQLVDQDGASMFPSGSNEMADKPKKLMAMVAQIVEKLPNQITIRGHTDSSPYHTAKGYTNWDLSADRANASRRALVEAGLDPAKIASVTGKADRDPLFPENPAAPENRRISIILLRGDKPVESDSLHALGSSAVK